jgi:hypothetical protein
MYNLTYQQEVLNIDETGHKEKGARFWTWVFRASKFAVFRISAHRSSAVLRLVLGKGFAGLIGCDYFSAYHKYLKDCGAQAQFCLAHFIREARFLSGSAKEPVREYGLGLLARLRLLFRLHHRATDDPALRKKLGSCGEKLRAEAMNAPDEKEAKNLAKQFSLNGDSSSLHQQSGIGADQQPGRTEPPLRGARPGCHPRDTFGVGTQFVRAPLDRQGHLLHAKTIPLPISAPGYQRFLFQYEGPLFAQPLKL